MRILRHRQTDRQTDRLTDGAGFIGPADRQGGSNNRVLDIALLLNEATESLHHWTDALVTTIFKRI